MKLRTLFGTVSSFQRNMELIVSESDSTPSEPIDFAKTSSIFMKHLVRGEREYLLDYEVIGLHHERVPGAMYGMIIIRPTEGIS